jgi:hypothetical protein
MYFRRIGLGAALALFCSILMLSSISVARAEQLAPESIIHGLGMVMPPSPDVSLNRNFHVYKMQKDGVTYIQINSRNGAVVTALALTGDGYSQLPLGYLASSKILLPTSNQSYGPVAPKALADGQCPCGAQVVYRGREGTIIVVTDSKGNVIQVVVLPARSATA